ncbi:glycosyltransferase [Limnothrix sp. FACHB-708]|uniref:glycosyltransferase n=1 Tax=unclassified Limnothrix TaxID=2632864 RepID=UPI00168915C5|nr:MULTISPECIES: glycosyltransferase [unclassified Limnothrix]MBD2552242.1 glycosyltransferase [Limnothrix sp. FACHB-708]MBD2592098.1 glycosyltransferase [Limnothrix sp. FACHB-406]
MKRNSQYPLVSICIPLYNKSEFFRQTIESIQSQTYENLEIVISDNGSTDGSWEIAAEYANLDSRIRLYRSETTISANESFRRAILLANGEILKLQCADDYLSPDFVAQMTAPLLASTDTDFTVCKVQPVFERVSHALSQKDVENDFLVTLPKSIQDLIKTVGLKERSRKLLYHWVSGYSLGGFCGLLFRKRCLPLTRWKGIEMGAPASHLDWDFLFRLYLNYNGLFLDKVLEFFRYSPTSGTLQLLSGEFTSFDELGLLMSLTLATDKTLGEFRSSLSPEDWSALLRKSHQDLEFVAQNTFAIDSKSASEVRNWCGLEQDLRDQLLQDPTNYFVYRQLSSLLEQRNQATTAERAASLAFQLQWGKTLVSLRSYDYSSPNLEVVQPDKCFPHMILGNKELVTWKYFRRDTPHNWYVDSRATSTGFLSRDEAVLLHNIALQFRGLPALEVGCWMGWSACHLALAGVLLDVIDPILFNPEFQQSVSQSLHSAGVLERVHLIPGYSPQAVRDLASTRSYPWSLIFIDGNHDHPGPLLDAQTCVEFAAPDAAIVFHDLASPEVAEGLHYLRSQGWQTMIYQTMQIMGIAWRGTVRPVYHTPDPRVNWQTPEHLKGYMISGEDNL